MTKDDIRKTISLNKIKLSENVYQDDELGITEGGALIFEDISKKISETPMFPKYTADEIDEINIMGGKTMRGDVVDPYEQV